LSAALLNETAAQLQLDRSKTAEGAAGGSAAHITKTRMQSGVASRSQKQTMCLEQIEEGYCNASLRQTALSMQEAGADA